MFSHFKAEQTNAGLNFDIQVDKDKQVYCFIGENGAGKTNLLENIAKILICGHAMFIADKTKYSKIYTNKYIFDVIKNFSLILPVNVEIDDIGLKHRSSFDSSEISLNDIVEKEKNSKRKIEYEKIEERIDNISINKSNPIHTLYIRPKFSAFDKPLIFIGAKERGFTKNIDKNNITILGDANDRFIEAFTRTFKYMSGEKVQDTAIPEWFNSRMIINPVYISQDQNRMFEVFLVLELMQALDPDLKDLIISNNGARTPNLSFKEGKLYFNQTPIDKFSTGFVSIIKIFQEIIAGYGGWAGLIGETDLKNMDGVVFIDELEAHIHPKWQYKFIPLLKKFFPKTTFFIATHSPTIVSTTDEGEAYELIREGSNVTAKKLGNPKAWYLADVFEQGFHVNFDDLEESENETPTLIELLKKFSEMVKDYTIKKDDVLKQNIEELYQKILPSLAEDDPRRRSLDSLKGLVK